ncbi:Mu-like prophage major head subunit gpT family protein, partial [Alloalcanivorax xenomutans]
GFEETCYDGQYFFDTDHPGVDEDGKEVSVSNMQAGSGKGWFLLDTRRALKPLIYQERKPYDIKAMTAGDDEAVFMRDEYRYGVDGRSNVGFGFWQQAFGSKATLDETNFDAAYDAMTSQFTDEGRPLGVLPDLLVVGPSNRKKAQEVIKVARKADGADNANKDLVEILVVPWLA